MKKIFSFFFLFISIVKVYSQSTRLEHFHFDENRNVQLLGNFDSSNSFSVSKTLVSSDSIKNWKKPIVNLLPFNLIQQFNSNKPYGWNDGPMQQAKGLQAIARMGAKLNFGIFEVQLAPEFLYVGNQSYKKIFPGQSFIRANIGRISFGVSSENLWWGPGINSSLLMSYNAPGFKHAFIGTIRPLKTPIGNIEFKIIGGKLTSDKNLVYENNYDPLRVINDDWRYLNAYVISWQPKWVKGLFLGMTRSLQQYGGEVQTQNVNFIRKYLPVLGLSFQKNNIRLEDAINRDQLASFFLRWLLSKSNAEFYIEYGKNDYGVNIRDYLLAPSHSYAYTIGFRKLVPKTNLKFIQYEAELTQLSQSPDAMVRNAGNWYTHSGLDQGYTHHNQILGAGVGLGSNLQTISATWINGNIRNGFLVQRVERDPVGRLNKWTDFSIGWMPQWKYKNMLLGAKFQLIRSNNYNWEKGNHSFNLHSRFMIQYNFK